MALQLLALAILSGWIYSSVTGVSAICPGLFSAPDLFDKDNSPAKLPGTMHATLNSAPLPLVIIHAGAALRRQFVEKDGVMARMLPFLPRS